MASVRPDEVEIIQECMRRTYDATRSRLALEIGVHKGKTAVAMSRFIEERLFGGLWIGVDPWACVDREMPYDNVIFVRQSSEDFAKVCSAKFGVVFVDGCHCASCVCKDIDAWWESVHIGGYMIFHDADAKREGMRERVYHAGGDSKYGVYSTIRSHPVLADRFKRDLCTPTERLSSFMRLH